MTSARGHSGATQTLGEQRLDKWLWFARIVKSRTLAVRLVQDGKVRVNRAKVAKPAQTVRPDDVLTIVIRGNVQVLKVVAPGARRGPPAEARRLYELLSPPIGAGPEAGATGERASDTGVAGNRDGWLLGRRTGKE